MLINNNLQNFRDCHHVIVFCECETEAVCQECGAVWKLAPTSYWDLKDNNDDDSWTITRSIEIDI